MNTISPMLARFGGFGFGHGGGAGIALLFVLLFVIVAIFAMSGGKDRDK